MPGWEFWAATALTDMNSTTTQTKEKKEKPLLTSLVFLKIYVQAFKINQCTQNLAIQLYIKSMFSIKCLRNELYMFKLTPLRGWSRVFQGGRGVKNGQGKT